MAQQIVGLAQAEDLGNCEKNDTENCTSLVIEPARFGGPDAVENQLLEDLRQHPALIETHALDEYFAFKKQLTEDTGIACEDTDATLTGETFGGDEFTGTDFVTPVNCEVSGCHP